MLQPLKDKFLETVLNEVKFSFAHNKIKEELLDHLDERIEDLMEEGLSEEEATLQAIKRMGNAEEIGRELNAVHKPLWGRLLLLMRIMLVAVVMSLLIQVAFPIAQDCYRKVTEGVSISATLSQFEHYPKAVKTLKTKYDFEQGNYRYTIKEVALNEEGNIILRVDTRYKNILKKGKNLYFPNDVIVSRVNEDEDQYQLMYVTSRFYNNVMIEYFMIETSNPLISLRVSLNGTYKILELEALYETE